MTNHTVAGTAQFGPLLRRHRTDTGLTQRMLADLSTMSVRAIRDLELGKARPRADTLRLITHALRLGRQAKADLEHAADGGRGDRSLRAGLDVDVAAPPAMLDAIVGRDAEVGTVAADLAEGSTRLVTVTGLPGVGKTRLAVEVASVLHRDSRMPVLWFTAPDAAETVAPSVRDPRLAGLLRGAANALFGQDARGGELAELIGDRDTLVVLDGITAHPPRSEPLLRLLGDCPRLRVLITADQPCRLAGERPFLLTPLATPTGAANLGAFADLPAAQLFLRHVRHTRPGYRLTAADTPVLAEVCALVDGLPPALAAAASWLDVYELPALREVLRADPAALLGQTLLRRLRARVAALPAAECATLIALADLGPDFTLDDVVAFTGRTVAEAGLLLRGLLLHGLVRTRHSGGHSRFQVLALLRALR